MTVLVGVLCTDGIVIGSDSIATSAAGTVPVMQILSDDKIRIFDDSIIVASTGAVGYTQRFHANVRDAIDGSAFRNFDRKRLAGHLTEKFLRDLQSTNAPMHPQHGIGFGALAGFVVKNELCLVEYPTDNFQPEQKGGRLFYVSMGSGQPLADPFLAFVSRVLWKDSLPNLHLGKLGVYWTLKHTLSLAPGMVGPPIRIATLQLQDKKWIAAHSNDLQETEQYIDELESRISQTTTTSVEEAEGKPLPSVPA